jgi:hypothetical protein
MTTKGRLLRRGINRGNQLLTGYDLVSRWPSVNVPTPIHYYDAGDIRYLEAGEVPLRHAQVLLQAFQAEQRKSGPAEG